MTYNNTPILSSPPRKSSQNQQLKRRTRVRKVSLRGAKRLEVLPELSEVDESSYESEASQSDAGSVFSLIEPSEPRSRRRPRPVGIIGASDLSLSTKLSLADTKYDIPVLVRTPEPLSASGESATLSFISIFADEEEEHDGYELNFPRPPSTTPSRASPTPSLESFTSSSDSSPSRSGSPVIQEAVLPDVPFTPSPLPGSARWNDGLDDLWSQLDTLLEWDPTSEMSQSEVPWMTFPETPSPMPKSEVEPSESGHKRYPSSQLDPCFPRPTSVHSFQVPSYPPPLPPKDKPPASRPPPIFRPPPRTPIPVDVEPCFSPTESLLLSPRSRFSISTIDSPLSSTSRLTRTRSQSSFSGSDSGYSSSRSSCTDSSSRSNGLRRKPIPIELFIR